MHAATTDKVYTQSVGTKVKPEMAQAIREAAEAEGLNIGAWLRQTLGRVLKGDQETRVMLAELMAFRTAMFTLQSVEWRGKNFTDDQLKELIDTCEARKFAMADKRMLVGKEKS